HKRRWPMITAILLACLLLAGVGGYRFYLYEVKKQCQKITEEVFTCAKELDFSGLPSSSLPEPLKSEPDVRKLIQKEFRSYMEESGLSSFVDSDQLDTDALCDEITSRASYQITDVTATYHSCTVSVTTQNFDFSSLPEILYDKASGTLSDTGSSFWDDLKDALSYFLGTNTEDDSKDLSSYFKEWYEEALRDGPQKKTDGKIVFGIRDGKWTLISFDKDLIYSFYGLEPAR
ncbi:MAG: hypothetical protein MR867_02385, partial [Eubacterium sp.]|nr:hypothetical protein [Eubacterium sp.]